MTRYLALLVVAGCTDPSPPPDVDAPECGEQVGVRAVDVDERVEGLTARELADAAAGTHEAELTFFDGSARTRRMVRAKLVIEAELVFARELSWQTKDHPDQVCPPTLDVRAYLTLSTDDGTLAGSFFGSLSKQYDDFTLVASARRSDLRGSYDTSWYAERAELTAHMRLRGDPAVMSSLSISMQDPEREDRLSAEVAEL